MPFADEIKKLRQTQLLSQNDFAQKLGVSFATINRWETGKSKPSYKTMKMIDCFCKTNQIDFDISRKVLDEE